MLNKIIIIIIKQTTKTQIKTKTQKRQKNNHKTKKNTAEK